MAYPICTWAWWCLWRGGILVPKSGLRRELGPAGRVSDSVPSPKGSARSPEWWASAHGLPQRCRPTTGPVTGRSGSFAATVSPIGSSVRGVRAFTTSRRAAI